MANYRLTRKQLLSMSIEDAWDFFSTPKNLSIITPAYMNFNILAGGEGKMYEGQIIKYKVNVIPMIRVPWTTEIRQVTPYVSFVDEQRSGPYRKWRHVHSFNIISSGIEMTDEIEYKLPFGIIGQFVHWLFVKRQLNAIFDYRHRVLQSKFGSKSC